MSDEALYQLELEKLFGMGWNLLGHESEIPAVNDYMVRPMGEDLVIVQRDREGKIHVTLNVCSHRGMRVALGEYGNTAVHKCIYHGWAFRPNGDFIGAPVDKEKMHGEICSKAELGLEKARVHLYGGLIFSTWNIDGPSFEEYLGDVQGIVDEYLADLITEDQFTASARPWEYYDLDYRPMVELAKAAGVPVLAANAPRRYVNRVSRLGPGGSGGAVPPCRSTLPPLPYPPPTDAYRAEWNALMAGMTMEQQCPAPEEAGGQKEDAPETPPADDGPHGPPAGMPTHAGSFMENGLQAQTLWTPPWPTPSRPSWR